MKEKVNHQSSGGRTSPTRTRPQSKLVWMMGLILVLALTVIREASNDSDMILAIKSSQPERAIKSKPTSSSACPPNSGGLIVSNMLGRLGNNFFEVSLANRLAKELCWDVVYRPMWQAYFAQEERHNKTVECFPNALLPSPEEPAERYRDALPISPKLWQDIVNRKSRALGRTNPIVEKWADKMTRDGLAWSCHHNKCNFTANHIDTLISDVSQETSKIRLLYLQAFFIHHDWMANHHRQIKDWFQMNPSCCKTNEPDDDTVVIHIRDHQAYGEWLKNDFTVDAYAHLLEHYGHSKSPIWIVCQPSSVKAPIVQNLLARFQHARLELGQDEFDALCIMGRARHLVLTMASTFSQMAPFLFSTPQVVHYPLDRLENPFVTIKVPGWKYHLVNETMDCIKEFDVDHDRLTVQMS